MDPYLSIDTGRFPVIPAVPASGVVREFGIIKCWLLCIADCWSVTPGIMHHTFSTYAYITAKALDHRDIGGSQFNIFMLDISGNPETTDLSRAASGISVTER